MEQEIPATKLGKLVDERKMLAQELERMDKDIAQAQTEAKAPMQEIREPKSERDLLLEIKDLLSEDVKLRQEANKNQARVIEISERQVEDAKGRWRLAMLVVFGMAAIAVIALVIALSSSS